MTLALLGIVVPSVVGTTCAICWTVKQAVDSEEAVILIGYRVNFTFAPVRACLASGRLRKGRKVFPGGDQRTSGT